MHSSAVLFLFFAGYIFPASFNFHLFLHTKLHLLTGSSPLSLVCDNLNSEPLTRQVLSHAMRSVAYKGGVPGRGWVKRGEKGKVGHRHKVMGVESAQQEEE